jgi:hypothetical protein
MPARRLSTAERAIFEPGSAACHAALQELALVLQHLGFTVRKKSARESTLRVYPRGHHRYPLLNPRFTRDPVVRVKRQSDGYLECAVWSKGDDRLDHHLRSFQSTPECEFVATGLPGEPYFHHGDFVMPVDLVRSTRGEVDFASLGRCLQVVRNHLQAPF